MAALSSAAVLGALALWTAEAERTVHYIPKYDREDLEPLLGKEELSKEDYALLFRQTGLGREGVDDLYRKARQGELLYLQERFFAPVEVECCQRNLLCRSERLTDMGDKSGNFLPAVRTGDILITFSAHFLGWRNGHAGLVVDGEKGLTLEALTMGCDSRLCSLGYWEKYPSLALVRLKGITEEEADEVAEYAMEKLDGVPYKLTSLARGTGAEEALDGTQCAHLIWAAYQHLGYDLDSDGGLIVTPADLYGSSLLEVIQIYGIPPESCLDR